MEELWEVTAIKYAERNNRTRNESFIVDDDHASGHEMDYFLWVLRSDHGTIVIDTGYDAKEGARRGRPVIRDPDVALRSVGVEPDTIDTVIITHLHYDHAGGLDRFPRATFHVQQAEMAYVTGPCMCHPHLRYPFTADHVCQAVRLLYDGRLRFHDGDAQIAPGVTVHRIGGHTKGLQAVRVKTSAGWMCLASDASHYYENFVAAKPFPIVVDLKEMLDGFIRIQELASSPTLVVPGHDPKVFRFFDAMDGLPEFARRLDLGPNGAIAAEVT